jgi:hypothetical protein
MGTLSTSGPFQGASPWPRELTSKRLLVTGDDDRDGRAGCLSFLLEGVVLVLNVSRCIGWDTEGHSCLQRQSWELL